MYSMTGFGSGKCVDDGREITIEIKSVNHRFLDISQKLPKFLSFLENKFREIIAERISRGHIEIYISYNNYRDDSKKIQVDNPLLNQYMNALKDIGSAHSITGEITYNDIMRMQGVFTVIEEEENQQAIRDIAVQAINIAIDKLIIMRNAEGKHLYNDVQTRMSNVENMFNTIIEEAPKVPNEYMIKLKTRIQDMLLDADIDESRIVTEAAIFADKCNIDEEIARFKSHVAQFYKALNSNEPIGRKLDFTLQEINREINTIGSKANNATITTTVMNIKAELEKIREQVQNIE